LSDRRTAAKRPSRTPKASRASPAPTKFALNTV